MKCTVCGSEWNSARAVSRCPFCGAELAKAPEKAVLPVSEASALCPICAASVPAGEVCPECGYDPSCDAETFGTFSPVLPSGMKTLAARKQAYENAEPQQQAEQASEESLDSIRKAAEQGSANAQKQLGNCYYYGQGVTQDYAQAAQWYHKAAEQGNADAQCRLGCCYYYGEGVVQDYDMAVVWYQKAANQNDADAQYNLGWCFAQGKGLKKNYAKAVEWFQKAAEQGNEEAQAELKSWKYRFLNLMSAD